MKRKFLAVLLAAAMIATQMASIVAIASTEEVTNTYFDFDFENWDAWGDYKFDGGKQSDGSEVKHEWSGTPWVMAATTDDVRGGKVMRAAIPTTGENSSGYYLRTRMEDGNLPNYTNSQVLWHEFAIKYEGGFVGFGPNENSNAYSIVSINKDGQIAIGARWAYNEVGVSGNFNAGTIVPDVQLELGNWYDIKVAADFTDADAGSGVPTYVWVNGDLVSSGIKISDIRPGYGWGYAKFYFDVASVENSVAYIDDIKIYDTAALGDIGGSEEPDPEPEPEPEDPEITEVPDIDNSARKTVSYYDIDFENWTNWGDNSFNGAKQSDGTTITHEWGAWPYQMSATTVDDRAGNVMQVNVPTSGGSNYLFRSRMRSANQPSNYNGTQVLWHEFSVKYEGGFAGFGIDENTNAYNIVSINKDGQIAIGARWAYNEVGSEGNFAAGTIVDGGQLELGQWYNIAVAADFTDAEAGNSGVPTYVWLNGELISSGIRISDIRPGYGWEYSKFWFDQATAACTAYIDDFEIYETADFGDLIAPEEPDPEPEPDPDPVIPEIPDIDNTASKTTTYFDIDFENWTEWGDNSFNGAKQSDGTAITHEWGAWPYQMKSAEVADRAGKVMQVTVPTSGGSSDGYLFRSRMRVATGHPSSYSDVDVLWNEFSVKYEGGFAGFGINENDEAKSIVSINKNGQIALGARWAYREVGSEGNFEAGTIVPGGQLELGQWYNIAVAADFTDPSAGVLAYVWVNGELIARDIVIPNFQSGTNWVYNKFYFDQATTACTAYIDDFEVYETAEVGNGIYKNVNVMLEALNGINANISTRNEEYHPVSVMADGLKDGDSMYKSLKVAEELEGLKVVAALDAVYSISSVTVSERWMGDQGLTVTVEIGKNGALTTVVDNQAVNKGSEGGSAVDTTYNFAATEGDTIVYTFKAATNRPEESDYQIFELAAMGSYVEDVAETGFVEEIGLWWHYVDNAITRYCISCNNAGEEISGKFFIAAYEGDELAMLVSPVDVTLKKGVNIFQSAEANGLYNANYTYKAFIWNSLEDATPLVVAADIIK